MANPKPQSLIFGRTTADVNVPVQVDASGVVQVSSSGGGGGAVTIADGADVAEGATTDAGVKDATGTVNAHLRGLIQILADVWDSVNHWFKVSIQNATLAVTQSGVWTVTANLGTLNGASTSAKQDTGNTSLASLDGKVTACNTAAVVVSSSALPALAATSTKQSDGSQKSQIVDSGGNVIGATSNALDINVKSGSVSAVAAGDVAAGASDSGNPLKIGGKAASAAPSAVTAAQRVNALFDLWGRLFVRDGSQAPVASTFTAVHVPATNVLATAARASAGSGKRNVCTGFTFTLAAGASAPTAAAPIIVSIIDGASGGGTYLFRSYINLPAVAGAQVSIVRTGLWLVGSQATILTAEFSVAGGTNTYESVALDGVVVEE